MSIAYLDPGNIESDLQSGVLAKYKVGILFNVPGNNQNPRLNIQRFTNIKSKVQGYAIPTRSVFLTFQDALH